MTQLPNSENNNNSNGQINSRCPELALLDSKQWMYVQNRYNLTQRERQIAELICQGLRNGSIARSLSIRPGTVKTHTRNIYRKVQVKSKIAMLLRFVTEARSPAAQYNDMSTFPIID